MICHEDDVKCVSFSVEGENRSGIDWSIHVWNVDSNRQIAESLGIPKMKD